MTDPLDRAKELAECIVSWLPEWKVDAKGRPVIFDWRADLSRSIGGEIASALRTLRDETHAAALEAAALLCEEQADYSGPTRVSESTDNAIRKTAGVLANEIRSLTPADAEQALAQRDARVRLDGLASALAICLSVRPLCKKAPDTDWRQGFMAGVHACGDSIKIVVDEGLAKETQ